LAVLPAQRAASTSHATSPPLTSLHARPMVSACHPTLRQQEPNPPAPPQRARPRTAGMHRVTDAPAPSCVGSRRSRCNVAGGVPGEGGGGCEHPLNLHALRGCHTAPCLRCLAGCVCTVSQGAQLTSAGAHWWLYALRCCSTVGDAASTDGEGTKPPKRGCRQPVCASLGGSDSEYLGLSF
jgi:hypothetical protein